MKKLTALMFACLAAGLLYGQKGAWESSIERDFEDGKSLYAKHLYNPAKTRFHQVIESNPPTLHTRIVEESYYYRAMCALFLMNKDAEQLLEEFVILYPTSPFEQKAAFAAAEYYFNKRSYRNAMEWLGKIDRNELAGEQKTEYYFKLGYSQLMSKERDKANLSFYTVKDDDGKYGSSAKYYYGHMAYEDKNYVTALENFQPLLEDESFGPVIPYYLAQIYYKQGEFDKLIEYGEPLLSRATKSRKPEIAKLLGEAHLTKENFKEAAYYLEFCRDQGGQMRQADHYSLGFAYYKTERYADAIQAFNKISRGRGELGQNAYYHLGDCYVRTGNKEQALTAFKAASEISEDKRIQEDAMFNYAKLNYELSSPFGNSIKAFQAYLKAYPNSVKKTEANRYLANLFLTTKDYENALKALSNTGLDDKEMQEAYQKVSYFRAVQLFNANQLDKALTLFDQSLKFPINPTILAQAHFWKAEAFYRQKKFDDALQAIVKFEKSPGSFNLTEFADARYNKAYCQFMLEDYGSSLTSFRLFIDNKNADPRKKQDAELRIADASFMLSKYGSAISYYGKYLNYNPTDADYALFQKALCQGLNGQRNEKVRTLEKLERDYPNSKYAVSGKYEQGATYLLMDKNNDALAVFSEFVDAYPQSKHTKRAWLNIGVIYRNLDRNEEAISTFKKVVADYPATPEAMEAIAFSRLVYTDLNRVSEYVEWVEGVSFADVKRASLDSTMFSAAFELYTSNDCDQSMQALQDYITKFPDGIFSLKANYFLGDCAYKAHQDESAEEALNRVVNEPRSEYTERSFAMLAEINYVSKDFSRALHFYEQLLSFSEEPAQLQKAQIGAMRCAVALQDANKALQYAEIILQDDRVEPALTEEAMLVRARSYWQAQDITNAHQAYAEVKEKTTGESQAEAAYYIAKIQNLNTEYQPSNETIFWMIDKLPSYQKWRYEALLIMADNYWQLQDVFQANYTLDFIIEENYDPDVVQQAQLLKEQITREEEQKEQEMKQREEELNEEEIEIEEEEGNENEGGEPERIPDEENQQNPNNENK